MPRAEPDCNLGDALVVLGCCVLIVIWMVFG